MQTTTTAAPLGNISDPDYAAFRGRVQRRFLANIRDGAEPLFETDVADIWTEYLMGFAPELRRHHACSACKNFLRRYGSLVTIDEQGRTTSAMWDPSDADEEYEQSITTLSRLVRRAKVTGVFLASEEEWGRSTTGPWCHFSLTPPVKSLWKPSPIETARQRMAVRREDFGQVSRALAEFSAKTLSQAMTILDSELLYRAEHVRGPAKWLADLATSIAENPGHRDNLVWRAIARAPSGFCHPRTSMIGTLLEDLESGMAFDDVSRRFAAKMHPLQYQRPQAAPSAGSIAVAEKLVADLGLAPSLERRYARLEEVVPLWTPAAKRAPVDFSVFGHLVPKDAVTAKPLSLPSQTMTWEKFARVVLPEAAEIEVFAASHGNYAALVTATHPDAPPILQWDSLERRNPVSWYVYSGGSQASRWNLRPGWVRCNAVTMQPSMWHGGCAHQGSGVVFLLEGARDSAHETASIALFPEILKSELHGIRAVIEAHSRSARITGYAESSACGLKFTKSAPAVVRVRVTTLAGDALEYSIDRWD